MSSKIASRKYVKSHTKWLADKWKGLQLEMTNEDKKDLLEKWQILGLSFIMMSKTPEDFHDLVKQEFGYIWDGKGWIKEVSYH